ncbi:hypothetical protein Csa_009568 [Cucumis sativus]|uniref:EF-hand domain-containing protein n=1 Tax=Cucumis sativus TaxID=3659 RepID=A0A0A0L4F9_CUCSA|nr:hypothetical protein Csa_009568 [Cucumis sativus]
MGQAMGIFGGKDWRKNQLKKITDRIFKIFSKGSDKMSCQALKEATLHVYNDINKHWPGPHFSPPMTEDFDQIVEKVLKDSDKNKDQVINSDEFLEFILHLTTYAFVTVTGKVPFVTLVVAPTVALVTKKSTEGIPGVGKLVQKMPSSAYAFLVTLVVVAFQNSKQRLLLK